MDALLRWSIENSASAQGSTTSESTPQQPLDPAIIDHILGKPDAQRMKEALQIAVDEGKDEDERVGALDEFEMLVEHIDNATDITKLGMWPPIQALVTSPNSPPAVVTHALWIIGTAVQNNPAAQNAYLKHAPSALPTLLSQLTSASSASTRRKAVYALSGVLKHHAEAVRAMDESEGELNGWEVLKTAMQDSDIGVRRKITFLLNTLLIPGENELPRNGIQTVNPGRLLTAPSSTSSSTSVQPVVTSTQAQIHEPSQNPQEHPNSHAGLTPSSTSTSLTTRTALHKHGLVALVTQMLLEPVPFGVDGDGIEDGEWTENSMRLIHTYAYVCRSPLKDEEKAKLSKVLTRGSTELWGLGEREVGELKSLVEA